MSMSGNEILYINFQGANVLIQVNPILQKLNISYWDIAEDGVLISVCYKNNNVVAMTITNPSCDLSQKIIIIRNKVLIIANV